MSLVIPDDILRAANISAGELRRLGNLNSFNTSMAALLFPSQSIMKSPLEAPDSQALAKSKPPRGLSGTMPYTRFARTGLYASEV